jgi:hypothetical protein
VPYIKPKDRPKLALRIDPEGLSAGELNYHITLLVKAWIGEPSYTKIATATGVLENVKQEFYRRLAAPYEDAKIAENGDVY